MNNWQDRIEKQQTRELALKGYQQKAGALFLPGWSDDTRQAGACIREALKRGQLDPALPLFAAERDRNIHPLIEADLMGLGFTDLRMHRGPLETMPLSASSGDIDFAFIDLFGGLDRGTCVWLRERLQSRISHNGLPTTIALTVSYAMRSEFMRKVNVVIRDHFPDVLDYVVRPPKGNLHGLDLGTPERAIPYILMRACFDRYDFAMTERVSYSDSNVPMLFYKFSHFTVTPESEWPTIMDINALIDGVVLPAMGNTGVQENDQSIIAAPRQPEPANDTAAEEGLRIVRHSKGVSIALGNAYIWTGQTLVELQSAALRGVLDLIEGGEIVADHGGGQSASELR